MLICLKWCKNQAASRSNRDDTAQRRRWIKRKRVKWAKERSRGARRRGWWDKEKGLNLWCCTPSVELMLLLLSKMKRVQVPSQKHLDSKNSNSRKMRSDNFPLDLCARTLSKARLVCECECECDWVSVCVLHSQWAREQTHYIYICLWNTSNNSLYSPTITQNTSAPCTSTHTSSPSVHMANLFSDLLFSYFFLWQYFTAIIVPNKYRLHTAHTRAPNICTLSISTLQLNS